jgi:hypothetical protein
MHATNQRSTIDQGGAGETVGVVRSGLKKCRVLKPFQARSCRFRHVRTQTKERWKASEARDNQGSRSIIVLIQIVTRYATGEHIVCQRGGTGSQVPLPATKPDAM